MQAAPIPENEKERLAALHKLALLDTHPEERFDRLTRIATKMFTVPIATLTLIDKEREWFKSVCGLDQKEGARAISFCGHALLSDDVFIIPDTKKDVRFSDNPMVTGKPFIRFYAGVPLVSANGARVGVFCIKDTKPREFSKSDAKLFQSLAHLAETELNLHDSEAILTKGNNQEVKNRLQQYIRNLKRANTYIQELVENLIREKKYIAAALVKQEAILLSIGDGLFATDEKGNITMMNRTAQRLLGIQAHEAIGKVFSKVIPMEDEKGGQILPEKRPLTAALAMRVPTILSDPAIYFVRKDQKRFPVAITITPVIFEMKMIGAIEIFKDITREKEIDRAKSEFVSLASHQLKTPPTAIKLLSERLLSGKLGTLTAKQKEYLNDIYAVNMSMIDTVNTLLDISRIELGTFTLHSVETNTRVSVTNIIDELQIIIEKNKLHIDTVFPEKDIVLKLDETLFHMAVSNIISNAISYTPEAGKIRIECRMAAKGQLLGGKLLEKDYFVVMISDNGCGIPKDDQHKVFTRFFRADNAKKIRADGTGLGLYLVKSILEHSSGCVWFTSREQEGSEFYVAIPMSGMKAAAVDKGK